MQLTVFVEGAVKPASVNFTNGVPTDVPSVEKAVFESVDPTGGFVSRASHTIVVADSNGSQMPLYHPSQLSTNVSLFIRPLAQAPVPPAAQAAPAPAPTPAPAAQAPPPPPPATAQAPPPPPAATQVPPPPPPVAQVPPPQQNVLPPPPAASAPPQFSGAAPTQPAMYPPPPPPAGVSFSGQVPLPVMQQQQHSSGSFNAFPSQPSFTDSIPEKRGRGEGNQNIHGRRGRSSEERFHKRAGGDGGDVRHRGGEESFVDFSSDDHNVRTRFEDIRRRARGMVFPDRYRDVRRCFLDFWYDLRCRNVPAVNIYHFFESMNRYSKSRMLDAMRMMSEDGTLRQYIRPMGDPKMPETKWQVVVERGNDRSPRPLNVSDKYARLRVLYPLVRSLSKELFNDENAVETVFINYQFYVSEFMLLGEVRGTAENIVDACINDGWLYSKKSTEMERKDAGVRNYLPLRLAREAVQQISRVPDDPKLDFKMKVLDFFSKRKNDYASVQSVQGLAKTKEQSTWLNDELRSDKKEPLGMFVASDRSRDNIRLSNGVYEDIHTYEDIMRRKGSSSSTTSADQKKAISDIVRQVASASKSRGEPCSLSSLHRTVSGFEKSVVSNVLNLMSSKDSAVSPHLHLCGVHKIDGNNVYVYVCDSKLAPPKFTGDVEGRVVELIKEAQGTNSEAAIEPVLDLIIKEGIDRRVFADACARLVQKKVIGTSGPFWKERRNVTWLDKKFRMWIKTPKGDHQNNVQTSNEQQGSGGAPAPRFGKAAPTKNSDVAAPAPAPAADGEAITAEPELIEDARPVDAEVEGPAESRPSSTKPEEPPVPEAEDGGAVVQSHDSDEEPVEHFI